MLPNILDIAHAYNLIFDQRNYGKKETLCKCPFCKEDMKPGKDKKFYLSLNTHDQVYKCWFCNEAGGVLQFEAKLSGLPFTKVKEKYFGKSKRNLHPAFRLTPDQLDKIGWRYYKQKDFIGFKKRRDQVYKDWKRFVHNELVKHFALFMCIVHIENQEQKRKKLLNWFIQKCDDMPIKNMYKVIHQEYLKNEDDRSAWGKKGTKVARLAWKISIKALDVYLDDLLINVLFVDYFMHKKRHIQNVSNQS